MYYVVIVGIESDKLEHSIGPNSESRCERIEAGVLFNLDIDKFYADTISEQEFENRFGGSHED